MSAPRSRTSVVSYLAFLAIVMAVGVDIALPAFDQIARTFGMTNTGGAIAPVGTCYFLGMATGQLIFGPAADRFGRNRCLIVGISLAIIGAFGAAMAPSFGLLLLARGVWGLGAASPAVLRTAIARDLFEGDEMASVVSTIMAVFLIGPIFVPGVGQLILQIGSWRAVFLAATLVAAFGLVWTIRFGETLKPEDRRQFDLASFAGGLRAVARARPTVWYILAQTFTTGAFVIFLGSGQPIIDHQYHRGSQFAVYFGIAGAAMALGLLANNRLILQFGAAATARGVSVSLVLCGAVGLGLMFAAHGRPAFLVWFIWVLVCNMHLVVLSPMCSALALGPMGELAGTASAILGFVTLAGGALLASLVDGFIVNTTTPMGVGYLGYGILAAGCVVLAQRAAGVAGVQTAPAATG